jgi:hypothetical protein
VLWAGFDHGSIAGKEFGGMGMIDYFRLPKRQWYWYRNFYSHVAPPAWPQAGKPAALRVTTSSPTIARADGTDDVQVVVSVVDAAGRRLSNSPPVHLAIVAGPGELPTGRAIDFTPDGDISIRDGQAAIAMRSWQAGTTRLRASSPGLVAAETEVRTLLGPPFLPGRTPLAATRPYVAFDAPQSARGGDDIFGRDNPTDASSSAPGHSSRLVDDGDPATYWAPMPGDRTMSVTVDTERLVEVHRLMLSFPQEAPYGYVAEVQDRQGLWQPLAAQAPGSDRSRTRDIATKNVAGRRVRVRLLVPPEAVAGLSELRVSGTLLNN